MTDEQMRIKIAESVGYKELFMDNGKSMVPQRWESPYDEFCYVAESLPDYLNDLNAMHEAEKVLNGGQINTYLGHLYRNSKPASVGANPWKSVAVRVAVHATARQRAEAFLKTLNLWKD